jgi:flagellar basal-body rod modification protein FlgD
VTGDTLTASSSGVAQGAFNLASASSNTNVTILNSDGSIAGTLSLGALSAGQQNFNWSGGKAGTSYSYDVTATDSTGAAVSVSPYSVYTVEGVNLSSSSPTLNVAGTSATLPVSSVQTVLGASS